MPVNKRAVSPLVATILLIAFAIALGAVVMNWGKGYIEEKAEFIGGGPVASASGCGSVLLNIVSVSGTPRICIQDGRIMALVQNDGSEISNIKSSIVGSLGVANQENLLVSALKPADTASITISYNSASVGDIAQVKITPQLNGEFCSAKALIVENIGMC